MATTLSEKFLIFATVGIVATACSDTSVDGYIAQNPDEAGIIGTLKQYRNSEGFLRYIDLDSFDYTFTMPLQGVSKAGSRETRRATLSNLPESTM